MSPPTSADGSEKLPNLQKHVPVKLYTKNRKEKAKEKLVAQDVLHDLQVEHGKFTLAQEPSANSIQSPYKPSSPRCPPQKESTSQSPLSLAKTIVASIINTPTSKKVKAREMALMQENVHKIPKYKLGKS